MVPACRCHWVWVGVLAAACSPALRPLSKEETVSFRPTQTQLDSLRKDSSALAACAALRRADSEAVYLEPAVDSPAGVRFAQGRPFDPPRQGDGSVVAVLVVKANGAADPRTVKIVRATDFEFGDSVLSYLRRARYRPAIVHGRPVDQCTVVAWVLRNWHSAVAPFYR